MSIEIKIPGVGESVQEAVLAQWFKKDGDAVRKDEALLLIETDKVTLEVTAEADGILSITVPAGQTVAIGQVVGTLLPAAPETASAQNSSAAPEKTGLPESTAPSGPASSVAEQSTAPALPIPTIPEGLPPSIRRRIVEQHLDVTTLPGSGPDGKVTRGDILFHLEKDPAAGPVAGGISKLPPADAEIPDETRKPMSPIRKRIAQRLLEARQNTAMLTTFNEIDMSRAMKIRALYKDDFKQRHAVGLGFMSFFIRACVEALKEIPEINAFIDGDDIIYHAHQHIGVAIGTDRGLVVPVIRYAEKMGFADIEAAIVTYSAKIKENRLALADLDGGTFTVSNGGVYGSLLSTPILNTPQSGILGMHKIEKRPVVVNDAIVIRPMMYVALSYDHRIVDGKDAVTFLRRVKEGVEAPERLMLGV